MLERDAVAAWTTSNQHTLLDEYEDFLRLPNVATDRDAIRRNADELARMMQRPAGMTGLSLWALRSAKRFGSDLPHVAPVDDEASLLRDLENENLRVGHLWDGIATMAAVMRLP